MGDIRVGSLVVTFISFDSIALLLVIFAPIIKQAYGCIVDAIISFVYFLILASLLHSSILFNCFCSISLHLV